MFSKKNVKRRKLSWIERKKQATERFKGRFTYTLLFCVLGDSFRGGGGGGSKTYKQSWKSHYKTCVPQVKKTREAEGRGRISKGPLCFNSPNPTPPRPTHPWIHDTVTPHLPMSQAASIDWSKLMATADFALFKPLQNIRENLMVNGYFHKILYFYLGLTRLGDGQPE